MIKVVPKLVNGDFVKLRNKTYCIVVNDTLVCENGNSYSLKHGYGNWKNSASNLLDIIKVYSHVSSFDEAKRTTAPDWVEPFPALQNGDVVRTKDLEIFMVMDDTLVNQKGGHRNLKKYDGEIYHDGLSTPKYGIYNITQVYAGYDSPDFNVIEDKSKIIWGVVNEY